jgi:hypothetical protein
MKDPKMYREMCEPHGSLFDGNTALEKFFALVKAARQECRIADVHVLAVIRYADGDDEAEGMGRVHYGDSLRALPLLAEAYGTERANFDAMLSKVKRAAT